MKNNIEIHYECCSEDRKHVKYMMGAVVTVMIIVMIVLKERPPRRRSRGSNSGQWVEVPLLVQTELIV